jgi:hypothetical protein
MAIPDKKPYERLSAYLERTLPGELEAGKSRGKATADIIMKFNEKPASELFAPSVIGFAGNGLASGNFDSDYQAVLSYAISQDYILPSFQQQIYQNELVEDMKTAGAWDGLEFFYVFASDGSNDFTFINWANPGTNQATVTFGPIRETNIGWRGDAAGHIDTGYVASTQFTGGNDVSMGAWMYLDGQDGAIMGAYNSGGNGIRTQIMNQAFTSGGTAQHALYVEASDNPDAGVITQTEGLWAEIRTATTSDLTVNEVTIDSAAVGNSTPGFSDTSIWLLARHLGGVFKDNESESTIKMSFFGDRAVGQNIYTPFDDYLGKL